MCHAVNSCCLPLGIGYESRLILRRGFVLVGGNNSFLTCVSNLNTPSLGESNS